MFPISVKLVSLKKTEPGNHGGKRYAFTIITFYLHDVIIICSVSAEVSLFGASVDGAEDNILTERSETLIKQVNGKCLNFSVVSAGRAVQ